MPSTRAVRSALFAAALGASWLLAPAPARAGETPPPEAPAPAPAAPPLAAPPTAPGTAGPAIFPLSAVRPGMKGYGLTVKSATRIERFEVEVVDVMRNFLAKQDVILVRCLGDEFADHRIAQGMSGSPIYFEDRLAGALAYGWGWSKHALAGITPIEAMLEEGTRPLEGRPTGAEPPTRIRRASPAALPAAAPRAFGSGPQSHGLVPIATPICLGGFSASRREEIALLLEPLGFAVQAGGGDAGGQPGGWANLDAPLVGGATLMVDLVRGDLSASALGTCTYAEGTAAGAKVFGFGHPFNELGETLLPMSVGYVYTIVSSDQMSFKIGASIREVGAIVQDRNPGIVGVVGRKAPMVPFDVTFRNAVTKREERLKFEITANRIFLQPMMLMALRESFAKAETTLGQNTKRYRMTAKIRGIEKPWVYEDVIAGFDAGLSRVLIGLVDRVMIHPTQRAEVESLVLDVEIEHVDRRAFIESVQASRDEVAPGDVVDLHVRLRTKEAGERKDVTVAVKIPHDAPAGTFVMQVMAGDEVPADVPTPVDLADLPALYEAFLKSTEIVAVVPTGRVDLDMDGRLVRNLPLSSLPRLARSFEGPGASIRPVLEKVRTTVPFVVEGSDRVTVQVRR